MINASCNNNNMKNVGLVILKKIQPGDEFSGRTFSSPKEIQEKLSTLDLNKYNNYYPYTYYNQFTKEEKLYLPGINKFTDKLPLGANLLPVSTKALDTMTKHLIAKYPQHANKELAFINDGPPRIEFVQVTLLGTGLGLYYNQATGTPMGK